MKLLGEGLQYKVFQLGTEHVLKIEKTPLEKIQMARSWGQGKDSQFAHIKGVYLALMSNFDVIRCCHKIRSFPKDSLWIFANPQFVEKNDYVQDRVVPLLTDFGPGFDNWKKERIIEYFKLVQQLWQFGCHELTYNFLENFGIDHFGRLVNSDFCEMSFNKSDAIKSILSRSWKNDYPYFDLPLEIKSFFDENVPLYWMPEDIEKHWGKHENLSFN